MNGSHEGSERKLAVNPKCAFPIGLCMLRPPEAQLFSPPMTGQFSILMFAVTVCEGQEVGSWSTH